ncbi:MAG: glycosyltransferase family 2 protein [Chloroflexia bacterium]
MSSVSVVVPTMDRPELLRRCVQSVLRGERSPDRLVICDQSRDTSTEQFAQELARDYQLIEYVRMERPHASQARNAGFYVSSTTLVAFIDDDCIAGSRWLSALVGRYETASNLEKVSAVCGSVLPIRNHDSSGKVPVSSRTSSRLRFFRRDATGQAFRGWAPWDAGTGGNMLSPRSALLGIGGFDDRLGPGSFAGAAEDIDLLYRLSRVGTLVYEPEAPVYHPMQSRGGRLHRRISYGRGMGAMLALHMAGGDTSARDLLLLYLRHQIANSARHGIWGLPETALQLAGAGQALVKVWQETRTG